MPVPGLRRPPLLALASLLAAQPLAAQTRAVLERDPQPVSVDLPADWSWAPRQADAGVLELAAPDGTVRGLLWVTDTEQSAARYLDKMVGMKPLSPLGEPKPLTVNGREAWRITAKGTEGGDQGITETIVIVRVEDAGPAGDNHVLQLWCPSAMAGELDPLIERIIASLRIGEEST